MRNNHPDASANVPAVTRPRLNLKWLVLAALAFLAAPAAQAQVVEYYHLDGLGSVRVVTGQNQNVIERHDYLPFGEECTSGLCASNPGVAAGQPKKFTGKERDTETGLDYFGARYYHGRIARFTTVDPVYTWQENLVDPQRWNRYAYVRNNPLRYTDPDGRAITPETVWDVASFGMSLNAVRQDPRSVSNWVALGADAIAVAAPIAPAVGILIRGAGRVDDVVDAGKAVDNVASGGRTLKPGPHATESIPARGPQRDFTAAERAEMNRIGGETGCHTCGTTNPGTRSGNFVPDHQPPTKLNKGSASQELRPHCIGCSRTQGGEVTKALRDEKK